MIGSLTSFLSRKKAMRTDGEAASAPAEVRSIVPPRTIQPVIDPAPIPQAGPRHGGEPVPYYPRKGPAVPAVPPSKILATQDALIRELRQASALSFDEFDAFLLPSIVKFAEFVHLLPASEYDHHSDLGGLFRHGLEVALNASRRSEGKEFALNEVPSVRKFQIFRWRACALLGGMLHDLGKAVIDVGATDVNGGRIWNPHVQPLWSWIQEHEIANYTIAWRELRRHREHDAISATALLRILPDETMRWLGEHRGRAAYDAMLMALTGSNDRNNPLIEIIKGADGDSVATDRAESHKRLASIGEAGSRSNAAQIVRAMRERILQGKWHVNQLGSLVWSTNHGLYMLWPHCAKEVVEHLREQGITITNEPPLILSILREAGVVAPNILPDGKSYDLHRIQIHAQDRTGTEIQLDITAIKFVNDRVVPDVYTMPPEVKADLCDPDGNLIKAGTVSPYQPSQASTAEAAAANGKQTSDSVAQQPAEKAEESKPTAKPGPGGGAKTGTPAPDGGGKKKIAKKAQKTSASSQDADGEFNEPEFYVPDISEDDIEAINSGIFDEPPLADENNTSAKAETPLRDWGAERDHRNAVIEDNLSASRNPFPPTTVEGAQAWMERTPASVYLGYIVDQAKDHVIEWKRDILVHEDHLLVRYPLALDGCGTDPVEVLDIFKNEDWIEVDTIRPNRNVVAHAEGNNPEMLAIRFNHGITALMKLLLPPPPNLELEEEVVGCGPYIRGARSALLDQHPIPDDLGRTIIRAAFYDHLKDYYQSIEGGLKHATRKDLAKQWIAFTKRHGFPLLVLFDLEKGETPLVKDIGRNHDFELVPTYDRGFDETLIQRVLQAQ